MPSAAAPNDHVAVAAQQFTTDTSTIDARDYWIESLRITNFRSYRGRHVVGPFKRLTGVIGPNGAGKSNLMDAISFVLGVQPRHMRGSSLADLIYSPSTASHAAAAALHTDDDEADYRNEASVALTLQNVVDGSKTDFCRQIVKNGTHSTAQINGKTVSVEEYQNKLSEFNILVKARNFLVFQGDVVDMAQKSAGELGQLFEQISGSEALKEEYEVLDAETKKINTDLKYLSLQRHRIDSQRQDLAKQVKEVEEYQELQNNLMKARSKLLVYKLFVNEAWAGRVKEQLDAATAEFTELEKAKGDATCALREADAKVTKLRSQKQQMEKSAGKDRKEISELETAVARAFENVEHGKKRRVDLEKQSDKIHIQKLRRDEQAEQLRDEIMSVENSLKELNDVDMEHDISLTKKQRAEYQALKQKAAAATAGLKASRMALENRGKVLQIQADNRANEAAAIESQLHSLNEKLKEYEEYLSNTEPQVKDATSQLKAKEAELEHAQTNLEIVSRQQGQLLEKRRIAEAELVHLNAGKSEHGRAQKTRTLISELKEAFPNGKVYGTAADLCQPTNKKYATAITVALGKFIDCVIVDSFSTAKTNKPAAIQKAVEFLKKRRAGVLEFAAIDSMNPVPRDPRIQSLGEPGVYRSALDCMDYPPECHKVFEVALNDAVIVPSLREAEQLAYIEAPRIGTRIKVITLDGEKVLKNGNISVDTALKQQAVRFDGKETAEVAHRLANIESQLNELSSTRELQEKVAALQKEVVVLKNLIATRKGRIDLWIGRLAASREEKKGLEESLSKRKAETEKVAAGLVECRASLEEVVTKIGNVETEAFSSLSNEGDLQQMIRQEQTLEAEIRKVEKRRNDLKTRLAKLKFELERVEGEVSGAENMRAFAGQIQNVKDTLKKDEKLLADLEQQMNHKKVSASQTKEQLEAIKAEEKVAEAHTLKCRTTLRNAQSELTAIQAKTQRLNVESEQLFKGAIDLLKSAILEGINIPLSKGSLKGYSRLLGLTEAEASLMTCDNDAIMEISDGSIQSNDEELPEINYGSLLSSKLQDTSGSRESVRTTELHLEQQVGYIRAELSKRSPNLKAIEKHELALHDVKTIETQIDELKKKKDKKEKQYNSVKKERVQRFLTCFQHVEKAIDKIYNKLTGGLGEDALGGQAFLELSDGLTLAGDQFSNGILYNVIPPSKRFSDLRRLSGGEKTMAALALLFAMQSFRPSPFFILDEIDADLDPVNVMSLAEYIQQISCQVVVISHSDRVFSQADQLIGVFIDTALESSGTLSFDMTPYTKYTPTLDMGQPARSKSARMSTVRRGM